jgi:BirA family biotin operon repressor/biotin-[acetyl-CoA-carboxylase] ligase
MADVRGWTLLEFNQVSSTNIVAAQLDVWHAVRADTQTAGRGRFQRSWVSNAGGLWLSAVVPPGDRQQSQALPLAAGLAVIEALQTFGINSPRLRWPNDIMANEKKLAGLLVDSFRPDRAVIGIGVNISNRPAEQDPSLSTTATRVAELLDPAPSARIVAEAILIALRSTIEQLHGDGLSALCTRINTLWGSPRQVRLDLDGLEETGWFCGVDECGRLLLRGARAEIKSFEPHQVRLLRELN